MHLYCNWSNDFSLKCNYVDRLLIIVKKKMIIKGASILTVLISIVSRFFNFPNYHVPIVNENDAFQIIEYLKIKKFSSGSHDKIFISKLILENASPRARSL